MPPVLTRRHRFLPAFLILILLGTLGLAAGLQSYLRHRLEVQLAPAQNLGPFILRPPRSWLVRSSSVNTLTLEELAGSSRSRRRIDASLTRVSRFLSPLEHLVQAGDFPAHDAAAIVSTQPSIAPPSVQPTTIAGFPGILISQTRLFRSSGVRQPMQSKQVLAATILPSGQAIVLRLIGSGLADASDETLIRRVAESISLPEQPQVASGVQLDLATDVHITVPGNFRTFVGSDRFHVNRAFVAADAPGYFAVDLVPVLSLSKDHAANLLAMLMVRDPAFHPGQVRRVDARTFCCLRRSEDLFPGAAYLRVNDDGRALLAEFRWNSCGSESADDLALVEGLWERLSGGLEFSKETKIPALVRAGAAAVKTLPRELGALLPTTQPSVERWQWFDETLPRIAYSTMQFRSDALSIYVSHDRDLTALSARLGHGFWQWRLSRDGSSYDLASIYAASTTVLSQEWHVMRRRFSSGVQQGPVIIAGATGQVTDLYIPGAVLPFALGQLPYEPMIVQTEAILSPEPLMSALPLVLLIEPAFDEPRTVPDEKEPMRCWSVRVNADGRSSRWYSDKQGRLHSITFAGGLHGRRIDKGLPETMPEDVAEDGE